MSCEHQDVIYEMKDGFITFTCARCSEMHRTSNDDSHPKDDAMHYLLGMVVGLTSRVESLERQIRRFEKIEEAIRAAK